MTRWLPPDGRCRQAPRIDTIWIPKRGRQAPTIYPTKSSAKKGAPRVGADEREREREIEFHFSDRRKWYTGGFETKLYTVTLDLDGRTVKQA